MREQQPSLANTQIAAPSADYVLAQLESASNSLGFDADLLRFDRFDGDALRDRLISQFDGSGVIARLRAFCKSSATNLHDLIESFGPHATVCNLLTLALARRYSRDALVELSREALDHWIRTLSIACAARRIAALPGSSTESMHRMYAAGLLHEVGVFVLIESFPRAFRRALDRSRVAKKPVSECEIEILGTDHLVIGRRTLLRSAMPEWLIDAAWLHERPLDSIPASHDVELIAHIQLAQASVRQRGGAGTLPAECSTLLARLGVEASAVRAALDGLDREVADLVERLRLDPTTGLAEPAILRRANADLEEPLAEATLRATKHEETVDAIARCIHYLHGRRVSTVGEALRACVELIDEAAGIAPFAVILVQPDSEFIRYAWSGKPEDVYVARFTAEGRSALLTSAPGKMRGEPLPAAVSDLLSELPAELACSANESPIGFPLVGYVLSTAPIDLRLFRPSIVVKFAAALLHQAIEREVMLQTIERIASSAQASRVEDAPSSRIAEIIANLAGGAAHELNNPLSVISGRAQMLKAEITRPDMQHALDQIEAKAGECNQIMRDLLEFAHPPAPNPVRVGVAELIDDALATRSREARLAAAWIQNLGCRDAAPPPMHLFVDREQVRTALLELLRNADEAIRDNEGLISIAWQRDAHDARYVVIELRDTGRGMTPEVARRAFDPFFSHRPAGRGRGLGLSRALRIVTAAGGTLTLESSPESGTVARVRLPLAESGA